MKELNVTLLANTPEPERLIAAAASLCYSPSDVVDILDGLTVRKIHYESRYTVMCNCNHFNCREHL